MLRLVPTIEIEPGRYARDYAKPREYPTVGASDDAWDAWFLACLSDAGISDLRPYRPRSWLISADQLARTSTMERILEVYFGQTDQTIAEGARDRDSWGPRVGPILEISPPQHDNDPAPTAEFRVEASLLVEAIDRARLELIELANRLGPVVSCHVTDPVVARALVHSLLSITKAE